VTAPRTTIGPDALEAAARERLPQAVYDYYAGGAEDEVTLRANRAAYRRLFLRPRVLVDTSAIDTRVTLLGETLPHPVLLAPTAFQRLAHADGEAGTARAAAAQDAIYIVSTFATTSVEDIAAASDARLWFQLYVLRDRGLTRDLVRRAEAAGARALCLTVTVPAQGRRERDARNAFRLPDGYAMANFRGHRQAGMPAAAGSGLEAFIHAELDGTLTWDAVAWLRSITSLPVLLKGVVTPEDARLALEHGAAGLIVSNHGGRQLDGAEPTVVALPRVADAVAGRAPVLVDGGVRRGSDIVKALASGATAVAIGRPYLWGLATGGQAGVEAVIADLRGELVRTMALVGRPRIADLDRSLLSDFTGPA
jgi:isopentenyl diphosphate isomerase/L-lactate dehydrogenase-like FMN-dependent dehydrogenase